MGLIKKLATAVRGGTREVLELAVDANGLRILAHEIHECEATIGRTKQDLCQVSAERIRLQREADELKVNLDRKTRQAGIALQRDEEDLAMEAAQWIADNEPLLSDLRSKQGRLEAHEDQLKQGLRTAIAEVQDYRRELRMAQATASAQSATQKISNHSEKIVDRLGDMQTSLQRIKAGQQHFADTLAAARSIDSELSSTSLDQRLTALESEPKSGSAGAVLERIRSQQVKARPE